jgi:hypothetical protein
MTARLPVLLMMLAVTGGLAASPSPVPTPAPAATSTTEQGPEDLPEGDCFSPGKTESRLVVRSTKIERFLVPVVDTHSHAYAETK